MTYGTILTTVILGVALQCLAPVSGHAQSAPTQTNSTAQSPDQAETSLKVFFTSGSSRIPDDQALKLDLAARTFRDGDPLVMVISGGADTVGDPGENLDLSLRRAASVADGLVERGIPVTRLQVLGRGNSELRIPTEPGIPEEGNRVVEISWR